MNQLSEKDLTQKKIAEIEQSLGMKQTVFMIGSKGIPARYGGFETFVDKLTAYSSNPDIQYLVACMDDHNETVVYNNALCYHLKVPKTGPSRAVLYDLQALDYAIDYCNQHPEIVRPVFCILACRIGPFMAGYKKKIKALGGILIINPDGHEWLRKKWPLPVRQYWKKSEKMMVKQADLLICDSVNIENYIRKEYWRYDPNTMFAAYGSDTMPSILADDDPKLTEWYGKHGLSKNGYYLVVGRFVPENNFETMIKEFMASDSKRDFAIITTANDKFLAQLEKELHFSKDPRIKFVGTVYDQQLLKKIRENAWGYFHGHEVGGTNPSLLEALSSTPLNLLLDVSFNREVGSDAALYWSKEPGNLANLINEADHMDEEHRKALSEKAKARIASEYNWPKIVTAYEDAFIKLPENR